MWGSGENLVIAPKNKTTIKIPAPHPRQIEILNDTSRFKVLDCGRRFGKSTYLEIEALVELLQRGGRVAYLSPTFSMLLDFWNDMKTALEPMILQKSEQEKMLRLKNGGYLKGFSANNPEVIRGGKYHLFLIDEAAVIPELDKVWNNIIRPTLSDYEGKAIWGSTPRGINFFKTLYDRGMSTETRYKDYKSFRFPSWENPFLKRKEILASAMDVSELAARQEIMAEFLDDAGSLFVGILKVATAYPLEPYSNSSLSIGLDLGRKKDYTVISVYDGELRRIVDYERFSIISWQDQIDRIVDFVEKWGSPPVTIEVNNMGDIVFEYLEDRGLDLKPFYTANENKRLIVEGMAGDVQYQRILLPPDPQVISEFQTFETTILPSGKIRYAAASGFHDDIVMSFCLARHGYEGMETIFGTALPIF